MNPSAFRTPAVIVVSLVLVAETSVLLGLSGFLTYQLVVDAPDSMTSAVGLASNQGLFARPDIGSGLFVPALVALALLLFSPSISKHLGAARESA